VTFISQFPAGERTLLVPNW